MLEDNKKIEEKIFDLFENTPEYVNVVGYGRKKKGDLETGEMSIVFGVEEKKPVSELKKDELLPSEIEIDGEFVKTDVVEMPIFRANACYDDPNVPPISLHRGTNFPYKGGIQISHLLKYNPSFATIGTLGLLCKDLTDNTIVGLTNAHVATDTPVLASRTNVLFDNKSMVQNQPLPWASSSTTFLKRYVPFDTQNDINQVDAAVLGISSSSILNFPNSFQQLNLDYPMPLEFANKPEIDSLVLNSNPLFKGGRTTGPVGWPNVVAPYGSESCSLTATLTNVTVSVTFDDQAGENTIVFRNTIFYRGTNTVAGMSGDSGSAVCALFNQGNPSLSSWKIVGLNFAGNYDPDNPQNNTIAVMCRIDKICEQLSLTSWDGFTTNLTQLSDEKILLVEGYSPLSSIQVEGKTYWQVSLSSVQTQNFYVPNSSNISNFD